MKVQLGLIIAFMTVSLNAADLKYVTIGDVSKIDSKNKTITIKDATTFTITPPEGDTATAGQRGGRGGRGGGASGGGGGRGGGRGGRGGGQGDSSRGGGGSGSAGGERAGSRGALVPLPQEYKVVFSSHTTAKDNNDTISFNDLKVGDRIEVTSAKQGSKIDAAEVTRVRGNPNATPRN